MENNVNKERKKTRGMKKGGNYKGHYRRNRTNAYKIRRRCWKKLNDIKRMEIIIPVYKKKDMIMEQRNDRK